tara:strand:- start:10035 stop:11516 length:1482 start_codon:yes stop_codon:yes gene_type:complete
MAITSASGPDAAPRQQTLSTNYVDFTSSATLGWAQQYLPDLMEKEAEIYGKRTISGFLSQVGAEEGSASDRVVWSEQGRLHLAYTATCEDAVGGNDDASDNGFTIIKDVDGNTIAAGEHGIRLGDTVLVSNSSLTLRGYVSVINEATNNITILPYGAADFDAAGFSDGAGAEAYRILVYGSEFGKGTDGRSSANQPTFKSHSNKHVILKDYYEVSGSDASAIGWVEVSGEEGQNGYLWYLKAEGDTRARFADYVEMSMMESEFAAAASTIENATGGLGLAASSTGADAGTEGLFKAIETRGHQSTGITGVNAATDLAEFDAMLAVFDQNGSIEENMMFVDRSTSLAIDDMLASMNSYGAGGTSYGVFDNNENMALNLGFSGFRRGSYDFYKSDFKYLNDKGTRGALNDTVTNIRGVVVPAGVSSVYDEQLGRNLKRPFLHVRYRQSETESRKYKTWVTGSVGAMTSGKDVMEVHYLSERCLITQGANNFMLLN